MVHSICTSEPGGQLAYFQRLWRTLLAPNIDPRARLEQLFVNETVEFDLKYAFLSQIDLENELEWFEIVHGLHEPLNPGVAFPLSKTYCRKTIADPEGTMAINDTLAEGWGDDPAYEIFGLGSYLGTTVSVDDDKLYGTLCFADTAVRDEPFMDSEKAIIEMHGKWVEYLLTVESSLREPHTDMIEGRTTSSEAIDSMMDALRSPTRRVVLRALLGDNTGIGITTLERRIENENARFRLVHKELPKLANSGYIMWDRDAGTISRGPKFSELEPLVELLKKYRTEISA